MIAELGLRFQPASTADLEAYRMRLELLASDCSAVPATLLRGACDRVARTAKGLPYASEILACVAQILEEQLRAQASETDRQLPPGVEASRPYASCNRKAEARNDLGRITKDRQLFSMADRNELRGCRADGTVIEPWFDKALNGWSANECDLPLLADQYRQYGRAFEVQGRRIMRSK